MAFLTVLPCLLHSPPRPHSVSPTRSSSSSSTSSSQERRQRRCQFLMSKKRQSSNFLAWSNRLRESRWAHVYFAWTRKQGEEPGDRWRKGVATGKRERSTNESREGRQMRNYRLNEAQALKVQSFDEVDASVVWGRNKFGGNIKLRTRKTAVSKSQIKKLIFIGQKRRETR